MNCEYRLSLTPQNLENAEGKAKTVLEKAKAQLGFIPNMYAGMANCPSLLDTYLDGYSRFRSDSGFSPAEQEVIFLTISEVNGCGYCTAAHSMIAEQMSKVPPAVVEAIRSGSAIADKKLGALSSFTQTMVSTRGLPKTAEVERFLAAGYQQQHVLQIILAIAVKTLSNYSNHILHTPVDEMFKAYTR